jgi:hypothetical protein
LGIVEIPTVVLLCLFQGLVAGYYGLVLLLSKLSKAQVAESSVSTTILIHKKIFIYAQFSSPTAATCTISRDAGTMNMHENIEFSEIFYVGIIFIFI